MLVRMISLSLHYPNNTTLLNDTKLNSWVQPRRVFRPIQVFVFREGQASRLGHRFHIADLCVLGVDEAAVRRDGVGRNG